MPWTIVNTETFSKNFKSHKKDKEFIDALKKKVKRLEEDPDSVGGYLAGNLHGYKSTRIIGKFRLIFKVSPEQHTVYLSAIDHRKFDYKNFQPEW